MMLSAVNIALPSIAEQLVVDALTLSWIPMAYLMASAALVLSCGRLADMFGRKRLYLIGNASLIVTSVLAACAHSGSELVFCRLLQGVSAAMIYGTHIAIVSSVYPPAERGRVIGLTVAVIYVGLTCGPFIGGWMISLWGWRAAFLIHVPMCMLALLVGVFWVRDEWRAAHPGRFDVAGAALYIFAIVALMYGISTLPSTRSVLLSALGVGGFLLFFRHQHGREDPLFDVSLFYANRVFTFSCIAAVIMYTATFANVVLMSLYLQYLRAMSPDEAGLVLMAQPLAMAIVSPYAGRLSDRVEARVIASGGMVLTATGLGLLATIDDHTALGAIIAYLVTVGIGFSLFSSPNANAIMGSVSPREYGIAGSSIATMRVLGQTSSIGLVAMVFALTIGPVQISAEVYPQLAQAISLSFTLATVICIPGIYLSLVRGRSGLEVRG